MVMRPGSKVGLDERVRSDRRDEIRSLCLHPEDLTEFDKDPSGPAWTRTSLLLYTVFHSQFAKDGFGHHEDGRAAAKAETFELKGIKTSKRKRQEDKEQYTSASGWSLVGGCDVATSWPPTGHVVGRHIQF